MRTWGKCGTEKKEGAEGYGGSSDTEGYVRRSREAAPPEVNKERNMAYIYNKLSQWHIVVFGRIPG